MNVVTLYPARRNPDKKAKPLTGKRIAHTDDLWVIRIEGEPLNRVLDVKHWTEQK